jgi:hypothetical protein
MRSGVRHLVGAGIGIGAAGIVSLLLLGGEYKAFAAQGWATFQAPPGLGSGPGPSPGPIVAAPAALLLAAAAVIVGGLCGWRRLSPAAALAAGLPMFGFGLLTWLDTWRVTLLFGGSLSLPWSRLVTDQVFGVLGGVLLIAAAAPSRWRPGRAARPISPAWTGVAVVLGVVAVPVVWYLVQLTNLTNADYVATYWWPFHQQAGHFVEVLFALVIATVGVLAASGRFRITALMTGAPMLAMGLLVLLAPAWAKDLIDGAGFGPAWRYAELLNATSGLPLLYGGTLVTSGLLAGRRRRAVEAVAPAAPSSTAVVS